MVKDHHKALVFDCDGTLADSMPVHWIAWRATLEAHGLDHLMPYDRFMNWGGVPATRIFETLAAESGQRLDARALALEKYDRYYANTDKIVPIEPIFSIARDFRGKLPMAVATGSTKRGVTMTLTSIGAIDWFDAIVTAEDVTRHKPHPETYLRAAELLGVAPEDCLAFEDAEPGIFSARDAGMQVIDVREVLASQA
jgi:beta-phosphoglucomutase-like phosphatase (HAD superfamily)